jgi:hypothetical protein
MQHSWHGMSGISSALGGRDQNAVSTKLRIVVRNARIYIGRLDPNITEESVASYLRDNLHCNNVAVEKLESKSQSACFKISCDYFLLGQVKS